MSRVDEALRRALFQPSGGPISIASEPAAAVVDDGALDRYLGEKPAEPPAPPPYSAVATPRLLAGGPPAPLTGTPVLSSAQPAPVVRSWRLPEAVESRFVISPKASSEVVEQYRRLATVLHSAQAGRTLKTLMVSSALPNEGKTLTITNLALTLSESYGRRVLLIDADFRHPSIHNIFALPNVAGIVEGLRSADGLQVVQMSDTLSVLPSGVTAVGNPMAELSSDRMRQLMSEASAEFDWVLLDTPPVGLLSDANLVAQHVDGVIFVIAAGSTPYPIVQRAIADLGAERIVGVVLNRVDACELPVHDYYSHYDRQRIS